MAQNVILDSSALVALLDSRDQNHSWARLAVTNLALPWVTAEAVIVEAFFLLEGPAAARLTRLLRDGRLRVVFGLRDEPAPILDLMAKYSSIPMSLADACLVRMTEMLPEPLVVTTDTDFKIYQAAQSASSSLFDALRGCETIYPELERGLSSPQQYSTTGCVASAYDLKPTPQTSSSSGAQLLRPGTFRDTETEALPTYFVQCRIRDTETVSLPWRRFYAVAKLPSRIFDRPSPFSCASPPDSS
jgi:Predicted nucleic acid-binding protein, contains PIN domain